MKRWLYQIILVILVVMLAGCSQGENTSNDLDVENLDLTDLQEYMQGKSISVVSGTLYEQTANELFPDSITKQFNSQNDSLLALKSRKTDAMITNLFSSKEFLKQNADIYFSKILLKSFDCAFGVNKQNEKLKEEINETVTGLKSSGKYDEIYQKWIDGDASGWAMPEESLSGENGVLRVATTGDSPPFSTSMNGEPVGFDLEILFWVAYEHGYSMEIQSLSFAGIISAVASGKADVAANTIVITPEREEQVLFSDPYIQNGHVIAFFREQNSDIGLWDKMKSGFEKNFIRESRWKMILSGLGVTIVISIFAILFGSVLGFGICLLRRSPNRALSLLARIYIRIIQGTPILVLLMIAYYIIFGTVQINAIIVAIIAFSMNFGAYVSETLRSGLEAVNKGQTEAAYAMGGGRVGTFLRIIFPQAIKNCMPVYKGEIISLVKSTSIVGYIAIEDLTKVSDIIRSRTYEAFFPLISTAVIYFVLSYVLLSVLGLIESRMNKKRRRRSVSLNQSEALIEHSDSEY